MPDIQQSLWNFGVWESSKILPARLEYLAGKVRGDASAIAWGDGKTLVVQFTASVASASVVGDVQICGPLYARAGGYLVAKDGTDESLLPTSWGVGDKVLVALQVNSTTFGVYSPTYTWNERISLSQNILLKGYSLLSGIYQSYGGSGLLNESNILLAANTNSGCETISGGYISVVAGDIIRVSVDILDVTNTPKTVTLQLSELKTPFANTSISNVFKGDGFIVCEHVATMSTNLRIRISSFQTTSITVSVNNITCSKISGSRSNLVSFGDSICATARDTGLSPNYAYTDVFCRINRIPYKNYGVGGETLAQILARFDSQVGTPSTIFLEGGANDLFNSPVDPTLSMIQSMSGLISKAKSKTSNVFTFSIPPLGTIKSTEKENWRLTYNTWLKTVPGVVCIDLDDVLSDTNGDQIASYYSIDTTHPNTSGHAEIVSYMQAIGVSHTGDVIPTLSTSAFDGTFPALTDTTTIGTIDQVQVWNGEVSAALVDKIAQGL